MLRRVDGNNPDAWFPWGAVNSELDIRHRGAKTDVRAAQKKVTQARQALEKVLSVSQQGRAVETAHKKLAVAEEGELTPEDEKKLVETAHKKLAVAEAKFQDAQQRLTGLAGRAPKPRRRGVFYV